MLALRGLVPMHAVTTLFHLGQNCGLQAAIRRIQGFLAQTPIVHHSAADNHGEAGLPGRKLLLVRRMSHTEGV